MRGLMLALIVAGAGWIVYRIGKRLTRPITARVDAPAEARTDPSD